MPALLAVTLLGFASYFLTLASLPAYAVQGGAGVRTAGAVTAIFLVVTIAGQSLVPALTARFGLAPVLTAGLLALGAPGPLYALDDSIVPLSVISAVRGAGFGVLTVLGSTLASQIAPPERRGEAIGLYSLAIGVPNLIAVPAGVALILDGHPGWLSGLSASPLLALPFLPALVRVVSLPSGERREGVGRCAVLAALPPSAVLLVVTLVTGGVVTFLPIERPDGALASTALLVFGITGAITR
jgi:MFS family permease